MPGLRPFIAALLVGATGPAAAGDPPPLRIEVGTLNVRYANPEDGPNAWVHRKRLVADLLADGDFWGLQEVLPSQLEELRQALPQYGAIGRSRERDPRVGEACPILYRASRWKVDPDDHGVFWLSELPDEPGSRGWDAALPRVATYGRFTGHDEGEALYVYCVHFDHRGDVARRESARLLARRIASRRHADPVIVLGDLNAGPESAPVTTLLGDPTVSLIDAWRRANPRLPEQGTFNGWTDRLHGDRIDFIFCSHGFKVEEASIDARRPDGRWPSDHASVRAKLAFGAVPAGEPGGRPQERRVWRRQGSGGAVEIDSDLGGAPSGARPRIAAAVLGSSPRRRTFRAVRARGMPSA